VKHVLPIVAAIDNVVDQAVVDGSQGAGHGAIVVNLDRSVNLIVLTPFMLLCAQDAEPLRVDSLAVSQRRQHGRLWRSPVGASRSWRRRPQRLDDHSTESRLGRRIPGVGGSLLGGEAIRLSVGRRHPFQHPSGRGSPVHPGPHGSDAPRGRRN
jgi:hypothetical protein